ncbi:FAD-binding oxidoreductase [Desulfogranum mediterraneum]|uniref:FAD-binding oxidoreductase n=1 Tax=Desulfogranum mediterraneum TaxID=160661 RepID=UPI000429989E|nr:FAD-linked oxidase C-terminal domain-containing protein [Desulfogranum mediterraneum]
MISDQLYQALQDLVGKKNVSLERTDRITHSYDATQHEHLPEAVVYAATALEVQEVVRLANRHRVPIIPRGAGSGFTGGTLPVQGGIVLVLTRMNRILEIDQENLTATVEPGVITAELQRQVEQLDLFYPPDPASREFCTLGGNVAECAGGPRCVKYGVTKDYVLGLEVVTPTGDLIHTGGVTMKNVVGYDLTRLFIGSEGTLGIVTRITLRLLPKPAAKKTMLIQFGSIEGAARAVSAIIAGRIIPTTLEFLDANTLACIRDNPELPIVEACQALLIVEVDGDEDMLERQAETVLKLVAELDVVHTETARSEAESEAIWQVRRSVSPAVRRINPNKFNEDIVVPRSRVPDMIRALDRLSERYQVPIVNFGHAGDGNIHVNVMVDLSQPGMQETVDQVLEQIFQTTVDLGGSISGEHGIGTAKAPYLHLELDQATRAYMLTIKRALDPDNILNPGKIFLADDQATEQLR